MVEKCSDCGSVDRELRPYGPGGSWICFRCAMATPATVAETEKNFAAMIDGAGPAVVIGIEAGPQAFEDVARAISSGRDEKS